MKTVLFLMGMLAWIPGLCQQMFLMNFDTAAQESEIQQTSLSSTIHYLGADFLIASTSEGLPEGSLLLKDRPWDGNNTYFLIWLPSHITGENLNDRTRWGEILYSDGKKAITEVPDGQLTPRPLMHGGIVRISPTGGRKVTVWNKSRYVIDTFPVIYTMIAQVDTGEFMPDIRHLEEYGTRYCTSPQAFSAQDWIMDKFESYPALDVALQDFPYWLGPCSDNVIATLPGKVYPDEFVVVGAHYDSFAWGSSAPGADDNASGTAAVLELARILSQYAFDRSLVFCCFSAEEEGLIGSEYYASQAAALGMNILGYFNFDMIGYRFQNEPIHTDMIAPPSAKELSDFYKGVVDIYLPDFEVYDAQLTGGDSDHTSFNNNGYMGIFPFEDVPNYSPYIHTDQDLVGPSVNSPEMAGTFIQANLASVVSLAQPYDPVGITDPGTASCIHLSPNPASSTVNLSCLLPGCCDLRITWINGAEMFSGKFTTSLTIDLSGFVSGLYLVTVTCGDRKFHRLLMVAK
jgi:hypothetical protein